jgi:hypothetical protein
MLDRVLELVEREDAFGVVRGQGEFPNGRLG